MMDVVLWVLQVLLALFFLMAGAMKVSQPRAKLAARMAWVSDFTDGQVKLIGVLELLGAVGLLLPALTGILPWLTPLAAVGLALTMAGAALTHMRRGEYPMIAVNVVVLAGFIAVGRFVIEPL
jgi:uncharacterized membrane protein YphA (DoxX/SURF4 family)